MNKYEQNVSLSSWEKTKVGAGSAAAGHGAWGIPSYKLWHCSAAVKQCKFLNYSGPIWLFLHVSPLKQTGSVVQSAHFKATVWIELRYIMIHHLWVCKRQWLQWLHLWRSPHLRLRSSLLRPFAHLEPYLSSDDKLIQIVTSKLSMGCKSFNVLAHSPICWMD